MVVYMLLADNFLSEELTNSGKMEFRMLPIQKLIKNEPTKLCDN